MSKVSVLDNGEDLSPQQLLIDSMQLTDNAKSAIVIVVDNDGGIHSGWTATPSLELLGLLHIAAREIADGMLND